MPKLGRPSPALVIAFLALFVAASGGAWAASGNLGSAHVAAHGKSKVKRGPRGPRGFRGRQGSRGPQGPAGAGGPAGTPGAVGPSDGFVKSQLPSVTLPAATDTTVAQLVLAPNSSYIVTAVTELGNTSGTAGFVNCTLLENSTPLGAGSAEFSTENVFGHMVTLTGASTGGAVKLSCNPDVAAAARNTVITAVKVETLNRQ